MKCPVCGAETSGLLWFDGSRAFFQCSEHSNHLILHAETFKKLLSKRVFERAERIPESSTIFINSEEIEIIAAMGSRVASPTIMNIVNNITIENIEALYNKYIRIILIIQEEIEYASQENF